MGHFFAAQLLGDADPDGLVDADDVLVMSHQHLVLIAVDVQMDIGLSSSVSSS